MSPFVSIPTPNSRLLYAWERIEKLDCWQSALARVEANIWQDRGMDEANSSVYLYFFAPSEEWGADDTYWTGREIIGMPRETGERMALYDLDRGHCHRATLGRFPAAWEVLTERETELRRAYAMEQGHPPASTWRTRFDSEEPQKIFLELFAEK